MPIIHVESEKFTPAKKIYTNIFVAFVTNMRYGEDTKYTLKRLESNFEYTAGLQFLILYLIKIFVQTHS